MPLQDIRRKHIGPKVLVLAKGYLKLYRVCVVTLSRKHGAGMVEDVTPSLHTLVEPAGAMPFFVELMRKSLAATVVHRVNYCHVEFVGMIGHVVCRGHSVFVSLNIAIDIAWDVLPCCTCSHNQDLLLPRAIAMGSGCHVWAVLLNITVEPRTGHQSFELKLGTQPMQFAVFDLV